MNQRLSGILVIALLISGVATYVVYRLVAARGSQAPAVPTTQVVIAARPLAIGVLIKSDDLKMGPWLGTVPVGMVTKPEVLVGRGVVAQIYDGEPILETRLAPAGAGGGLAATIPPGMRAVAVRVNDIVGVAGFVLPGMRVDVLISGLPPGGGANGPKVKTLLQNIEVLSAGQNYQKDNEGKPVVVPVVNLLVNPEQAEILSLASNETRIQLVLRNPLDTELAKTTGTVLANLYGEPKPPIPAPRPRPAAIPVKVVEPARVIALPPYRVEVLNGPQGSVATFAQKPEGRQ
jgi:pilus assembly protein CpaB